MEPLPALKNLKYFRWQSYIKKPRRGGSLVD